MASFSDEVQRATRELGALANAAKSARGGVGSAGGGGAAAAAASAAGGGGGSLANVAGGLAAGRAGLAALGPAGIALAAGGALVDAAAGAARFATPAANAFAVTGSSAAFAAGVTQSTLAAVGGTAFGGLLLGATGVAAAATTNQRAGEKVLDVTRDLAAIGIDIGEERRQAFFKAAQEQSKRITKEEGEVQAIAGSADALDGARPAGAGDGFDKVVSILQSIESLMRNLTGGGR